jgi:hypothetical protein
MAVVWCGEPRGVKWGLKYWMDGFPSICRHSLLCQKAKTLNLNSFFRVGFDCGFVRMGSGSGREYWEQVRWRVVKKELGISWWRE